VTDERTIDELPAPTDPDPAEATGAHELLPIIDGYRVLKKIGEGAHGVVYVARRDDETGQLVAIKVIKPWIDSKQVLARFDAERQALGLLDHPNIARVYPASSNQAGIPYFVMEYIRGIPITQYCDDNRLSIDDRLRLFLDVCEGVQHAHQKGIVHRDIKPSNILVTVQEDIAVPKLIDFGVAKALGKPLTEQTLFTEQGQLIGTPEYMSPEQIGLAVQGVDTRSDIYSLGVLLYELLTGVLPFDRKALRLAAFGEIQRLIQETDPPRPSERLAALGGEAEKLADLRQTSAARLTAQLRKELEWIPLKAMRKEPNHRYRSASELGDDIRNYLAAAPLVAGPESRSYRIKKFVRRNRVLVAAVVTVAATLLLGFVVSTTLYWRAEQLRLAAKRQGRVSEAYAEFHKAGVLVRIDPNRTSSPDPNVVRLLDEAAATLTQSLTESPLTRASVQVTIGKTYGELGVLVPAESHLRSACETFLKELGYENTTTLSAMYDLASCYLGCGQLVYAESLGRSCVNGYTLALGEAHADTLKATELLASICFHQGSVQEAVALHGRCQSIQNGKPAEYNQERQISHGDIIQFLMHERRSKGPMARSVNLKQPLPAPPMDFFEKINNLHASRRHADAQ
jgi:serine/threonine protein kinase